MSKPNPKKQKPLPNDESLVEYKKKRLISLSNKKNEDLKQIYLKWGIDVSKYKHLDHDLRIKAWQQANLLVELELKNRRIENRVDELLELKKEVSEVRKQLDTPRVKRLKQTWKVWVKTPQGVMSLVITFLLVILIFK